MYLQHILKKGKKVLTSLSSKMIMLKSHLSAQRLIRLERMLVIKTQIYFLKILSCLCFITLKELSTICLI